LIQGRAPSIGLLSDPRLECELYDPELLDSVCATIARDNGEWYPGGGHFRKREIQGAKIEIAPNQIRAGITLKSDLVLSNGTPAVAVGRAISNAQIELLSLFPLL
jgi:hypothetical protein